MTTTSTTATTATTTTQAVTTISYEWHNKWQRQQYNFLMQSSDSSSRMQILRFMGADQAEPQTRPNPDLNTNTDMYIVPLRSPQRQPIPSCQSPAPVS